ncbi:hypothetical protein LSTR_LSTR015539 [Laodelphax striatellus]|uniref:Uncharacterized protein n=1 Tax=Laodelphax striatellus TaxID=195883 RepID=A0A482WXU9_LAOST|nr:hypothetical protein LSTR_LSTR015539 [Laodelphax striatellus]
MNSRQPDLHCMSLGCQQPSVSYVKSAPSVSYVAAPSSSTADALSNSKLQLLCSICSYVSAPSVSYVLAPSFQLWLLSPSVPMSLLHPG